MHLHVTDQDIRANKQGNHIRLTREGELVGDFLIDDIDTAAFYGTARPTTEALLAMLDSGTDITFLSRGGRVKGRMVSEIGKNAKLRLSQYQACSDTLRSFKFAKEIILRKAKNGLALLNAYSKNPHSDFKFTERRKMQAAIRAIEKCDSNIDKLRGYEGSCAKIYFEDFGKCINGSTGITFSGRQYRPCKDPVNVLLSLGYTFVARETESLLVSYSFDPMLGFMHTLEYGRASLALDIMEEFRHPLVDRLVLRLINQRIITADDFEFRTEESDCSLNLKRTAFGKFLKYYEETCDSPNRICIGSETLTWRALMRNRVEALRRNLLGDEELQEITYNYETEAA